MPLRVQCSGSEKQARKDSVGHEPSYPGSFVSLLCKNRGAARDCWE